MKRFLLLLFGLAFWLVGYGNNVRIEGDVRVMDSDVTGTTANVKIKLRWDHSWRDSYNYDAVYVFLKYKRDGDDELWHHAYLSDAGHKVPGGYACDLSKTSTTGTNQNQGVFIYRTRKWNGDPSMDLELKWDIAANPDKVLNREMFIQGQVFISAMGIEMVYIPRGAFRLGDTESSKTFYNKEVTLPAANDLIGTSAVDACESSIPLASNPPEFAMNRMNDISADNSNAWVGRSNRANPDFYDYWRVNFKQPVVVRNLAIESIPGGVPSQWELQAYTGNQWLTLYQGVGTEWAVNSHRTYPCTKTIRIRIPNGTSYVSYRICITDMGSNTTPVIKNIAMSDQDVFDTMDNSVLISGPGTKMSNRYGLYAGDSDSTSGWSGNLHAQYPNGYGAFYVMKYEITQEQYVAFLNKLTATQQRLRTIGSALESLPEGSYVFGPHKTRPSARNGIKLASIGVKSSVGVNDAPYVFANDLDPATEYSQDGDGQTIACNFLNAGDMLAYADWCGLRPLTEMEFEKMSRRPYPFSAIRREYVWNTAGDFTAATTINPLSLGTRTEKLEPVGGAAQANINANNQLNHKGPVRAGAFSTPSTGRIASGSSFWGVVDLGGNLSELYYNTNIGGRLFRGTESNQHGDGKLASGGASDVGNNIWPVAGSSFCLRGGNFRDSEPLARISDRSRNVSVFSTDNAVYELKDSTMTFRLGRTAPLLTLTSEVRLSNGQTSARANAGDSICSGSDYVIEGVIPDAIEGAYRVAWFMSSDNGGTWDHLEGEERPSLKLTNLRNINARDDVFKQYWYKRMIYSNQMDVVQTHPVCIWVINRALQVDRLQDTVDVYDYSRGIRVQVPQQSTFTWTWLRENSSPVPVNVEYVISAGKIERHFFKYTDFFIGSQYTGDQKILLEVTVMKKCSTVDTARVFVQAYPDERNNVNNDVGLTVNTNFRCGDILVDNEEAVGQHKKYRTIEIGGRCWFADNLNRTAYNKAITAVYSTWSVTAGDICYDNNQVNCDKYGRLYNYQAVAQAAYGTDLSAKEGFQGICPKGWHVPSNPEWIALLTALGQEQNTQNNALKLQSSLNDWTYQGAENRIGTDESRFNALPGGGRFFRANATAPRMWENRATGDYDINQRGWWWTSTVRQHHWNTNSTTGDRNTAMIPYNVTLNYLAGTYLGNTLYTLTTTAGSTYTYLNSVLASSGSYNYIGNSYNSYGWNIDWNRQAGMMMWGNFYMSVRCVRDVEL